MKLRDILLTGAAGLALAACGEKATETSPVEDAAADVGEAVEDAADAIADAAEDMSASARLDAVLAAQPDETKARYADRHPKETLEFFGVEPGMTVVDTLPGEPGWYAPILLSYLGSEGKLIGADYSMEMWPLFTGFATEEFLERRKTWTQSYVDAAEALRGEDSASVGAFVLGSAPEDLAGTVDVVLVVRAAHHFNRLEGGRFFTEALADYMTVLKPGGVVGVVQHRAAEDADDEWAVGNAGYIKESAVIAAFETAGFELVAQSEINANAKDKPTTDDFVWRLPPTLGTSRDNPELRAEMEAIGESDRMTILFRKPE